MGLTGDSQAVAELRALWPGRVTNRDPQQLTYVAMTGVTALVRATATRWNLTASLYPGEEVGPVAPPTLPISAMRLLLPPAPPPDPVGGTTFIQHQLLTDLPHRYRHRCGGTDRQPRQRLGRRQLECHVGHVRRGRDDPTSAAGATWQKQSSRSP